MDSEAHTTVHVHTHTETEAETMTKCSYDKRLRRQAMSMNCERIEFIRQLVRVLGAIIQF